MVQWVSSHRLRQARSPRSATVRPNAPDGRKLPFVRSRIIVRPRSRRRPIRLLAASVLGAVCAIAGLPLAVGAAAAPPVDRLPDLAMAYPTDLRIQAGANGARRLRFSTTIVNIGSGPFETRSSRLAGQSQMGVNQRIYNSAGGYRVLDTAATARYSGDGHDHWHVQDIAHYELYAIDGQGQALRRDAKVGFCFFDTNPYRLSLPRAPRTKQYSIAGCGRRPALFVKNGISVGWGDKYGWRLAGQYINVRGLASGEYFLKVTVDPLFQFQEIRHRNNCNWSRIRISRTSSVVTVLERGSSCVLPGATAAATATLTSTARTTSTEESVGSNAALALSVGNIQWACAVPTQT
jgi:hypothetical protein